MGYHVFFQLTYIEPQGTYGIELKGTYKNRSAMTNLLRL